MPQSPGSTFCYDSERNTPRCIASISRFYILLWLKEKCTRMHASISWFYILLWLRKKCTQMHCLNLQVLHSAMTQREVHQGALPQSPGSTFCYDSEINAPRCTASISRFCILLWLREKCTKVHCLNLQVLHSAMTQREVYQGALPQSPGSTFCFDSEKGKFCKSNHT